ncbi:MULTISPECIES: hypothetical protein [Oceanobacillus]|uniref:hypothetical protein n=1 Tax=Oceanobacillus TaxID=182709 RepID=UPI0018663EFE|nr:hypothetical protein [Oceanobacillus oncorhynchi]UUI39409.1 hypothetical protein NP440_19115 [Oceanobacillus oncorhynchi]
MQKFLEKAFIVSLILSILTALIMVLTQLFGLIIGNGELMINVSDLLLRTAIILAAVFSGIAFILGYFPKYKGKSD